MDEALNNLKEALQSLVANIVLYLLAGDHTLVLLLHDKQLYLSFVSELELLSHKGIKEQEAATIKRFIKEWIVVDMASDFYEK